MFSCRYYAEHDLKSSKMSLECGCKVWISEFLLILKFCGHFLSDWRLQKHHVNSYWLREHCHGLEHIHDVLSIIASTICAENYGYKPGENVGAIAE